jgi:hypothetical protein
MIYHCNREIPTRTDNRISTGAKASRNTEMKKKQLVDSEGFRRWCMIVGINGFLDFVHRPVFLRTLKNTMFGKLDLFSFSGDEVGGTCSVGSVRKS